MVARAALISLLVSATTLAAPPALDDDAVELLESRVERQMLTLSALPLPPLDVDLAILAAVTPATVKYARVTISLRGEPDSLRLELDQGTSEQLTGVLKRLVEARVCEKPSVSVEPIGVVGKCTVPTTKTRWTFKGATRRREPSSYVAREQAFVCSVLPTEPNLDELAKGLREAAAASFIKLASLEIASSPRVSGPLDVYEVNVSGTAPFRSIDLFLIGHLRPRLLRFDHLELRPRATNMTELVEFSLRGEAYRYRTEDAALDQELEIVGVERRKVSVRELVAESPFAARRQPVEPIVSACATKATQPLDSIEPDEVTLAFVESGPAPTCAVVVDSRGNCHEVRLKTKWHHTTLVAVGTDGVTFVWYAQERDGRTGARHFRINGHPQSPPPAWACTR